MKTIGIIGGLSWESTALYYKYLNERARKLVGGSHSARLLIHSFDFGEFAEYMASDDWETVSQEIVKAGRGLQTSGADILIIASNTIQIALPDLEASVTVPVISIAEPTCNAITNLGFKNVGFLGTKYTMEKPFLIEQFRSKGIEVSIPDTAGRTELQTIIFDHLVKGDFSLGVKERLIHQCKGLIGAGAEGIVAGCTEIKILLQQSDVDVPLFATTSLHCDAVLDLASN